ncbi:MAG: class I SAM-dependent methyltransferase [Candidatus Vogelbacteria bacterium]
MMFKGKNIFNASFDVFAETYHSVRPGYPAQLYKDIRKLCGISNTSRLLEIGAGSGIATTELAKFGGRIVAIEPGTHLATIARKQTKGFKSVEILEGTFEDFESAEQFDAILAFTAYHWIDEGIKYQKVLDLLDDAGSLVLVWNSFFLSDSAVTAEVNRAYHEHLPDAYPDESTVEQVNEGVLSKLHHREQEVIQNLLLYTVALRKYYTIYNYNAEMYPKLLNTFPKIVEVDEEKRQKFFEGVSEIVSKHGTISVPVLTTLIVCKKRSGFLHAISHTEGGS